MADDISESIEQSIDLSNHSKYKSPYVKTADTMAEPLSERIWTDLYRHVKLFITVGEFRQGDIPWEAYKLMPYQIRQNLVLGLARKETGEQTHFAFDKLCSMFMYWLDVYAPREAVARWARFYDLPAPTERA